MYEVQRLKHALQALAAKPEDQLRIYPDFVCKVDELALDYNDWLGVCEGLPDADLHPAALMLLRVIRARLGAMSGQANAELWTETALRDRSEWKDIRTMACKALSVLKWPLEPPPPSPDAFVPGGPA